MSETILIQLTAVLLLGIGAQWLAWRLRIPSILLLLAVGFAAGPVFGWLAPNEVFGDLLMPMVSLSVALILFEGGLTLDLRELRAVGRAVWCLVTVGALLTWGLTTAAAHWILGWGLSLSVLLGAILVVTGPTVIMPLLRHLQPTKQIASVLKWEGIVIDPIGALLALLVFEAIQPGHGWEGLPRLAIEGFGKTIVIGGILGWLGAQGLSRCFGRYWIPEYLHNPVTLAVCLGMFTLSNHLQHESGLLTVTLMGILLANQSQTTVGHVLEFKENLRVLLISGLFIVLSARLEADSFRGLTILGGLGFLGSLLFFVRPIAVWASTIGSGLSTNERWFLSWMAPRGIVAAAVAAIFSLRLEAQGVPQANELVPVTFIVIVGTVVVYGLTSGALAKQLGVSNPNPQGILFVGADPLVRELAKTLQIEGVSVLLVDSNRANINEARMEGLPVYYGNVLSEHAMEDLDLSGIGRLMAMTPNTEVNSLAAIRFAERFGREQVYQLPPFEQEKSPAKSVSQHLQGRQLFNSHASHEVLARKFHYEAEIKKTGLTEEFDFDAFLRQYGEETIPMVAVNETGEVEIAVVDASFTPSAGWKVIGLVPTSAVVEATS